jgi:hypothetical protein
VGLWRITRAGDGDEAGVREGGGEVFSRSCSAGSLVESAADGEGGEAAEAALLKFLTARRTAARELLTARRMAAQALQASLETAKLPQKL